MIITAMLLSGAIAGLVGMTEIMDSGLFPSNPIQGLGFAGIAVALLGRNSAVGAAIAALIFAFLDISSGILQNTGSASREIVQIMQALIILAAVVAYQITQRVRDREEAKAASSGTQRGHRMIEIELSEEHAGMGPLDAVRNRRRLRAQRRAGLRRHQPADGRGLVVGRCCGGGCPSCWRVSVACSPSAPVSSTSGSKA